MLPALVALGGPSGGTGRALDSHSAHRSQIVIAQSVHLPQGRSRAGFSFTIHAQFADDVILLVPHGTRVRLLAMSADRGQMMSGSSTPSWGPCRRRANFDICEQGQEWCGLIPGRWNATVWKTSFDPAVVRVRLVFVSGVRDD